MWKSFHLTLISYPDAKQSSTGLEEMAWFSFFDNDPETVESQLEDQSEFGELPTGCD